MKKRKLKKKTLIIFILFLLILSLGGYTYYKYNEKIKQEELLKQENDLIKEINSHYNKYVKTKNDSKIYKLENNKYIESGTIYKDNIIELDEIKINKETKYFYIKSLDSYIEYKNVEKSEEIKKDTRYKRYIPFNKNIITKENATLYKENEKKYTLKNSIELPIIINNYENKYYIEYDNELLNINKEDIEKVIDKENTKDKNAKKITTLCYHRVYKPDEKCNDMYVCRKQSKFDEEIKYLTDNNYLTLKMEEMVMYLKGNLQIPTKSVLITLDDGYGIEGAIEVLEKYNQTATSFIMTGSFTDFERFKSTSIEMQSHTNSMHKSYQCPLENSNQQGGAILCKSEDYILNDLKTSREKLNNPIALAYPFYDYNTRATQLVEKAGFKIAFIGAAGVKGRSYPGINIYKVPRMTIWDTTTLNELISYIKN